MRRSVLLGALLVALVCGASSCGGEDQPVRIGVLADCTGAFGSFHDLILAKAGLPMLDRGGRLIEATRGAVAEARVGGRRVQLVEGCVEWGVYSRLVAEARRLVEQEHVDLIVGPFGQTDGVVLRDYLRRHPEVTGLLANSTAQAATLRRPAANVFRFAADGAQHTAGLGTYAYKTLGWRTAQVIDDDQPISWEAAAGFIAEFCSLGGRVVDRTQAPSADSTRLKIAPDADGQVVLMTAFSNPAGLLRKLAQRSTPAKESVLLWSYALGNPAVLPAAGPLLTGVAVASAVPDDSNARLRAYQRRFHRAFPAQPVAFATSLGLDYYTAMSAALKALESVNGDTGDGQNRLREALATLMLEAPQGDLRLDANRQVIMPNYLLEFGAPMRPLRTISGVEQTFGGYLAREAEPTATTPACRPGPVPPWAG